MSWFTNHTSEEDAALNTGTDSESRAVLVDALIAQLSSSDGGKRSRGRAALVEIGKPAVAALLAMLADQTNHIRRWEAAKALSEIADSVTAPALVAALEDRSFDIRWLAAEGLIALKWAALPSLLQALMAHSESVWLRQGAHHILCTLSDPATQSLVAPVCAALEGIVPDLTIPPAAQKVLQELEDRRSTAMNDYKPWEFTCKTCGGHSINVFRSWTILAGPDSESWQEWGPLEANHLWRFEFKKKIEKDDEVEGWDFAEYAKDDSSSKPEEYEVYEPEDNPGNDEFYVNCASCDREIEFGWSQPNRGGRIFPVECSDFVPDGIWPEPRYLDSWQQKGWLKTRDGQP